MSEPLRLDYRVILQIVGDGAKVLDLGCGDGELLSLLVSKKNAKAQGIELDEQSIYKCVEKGLSVFHSDIDSGLPEYPAKAFDYVILNQSLQQEKKIEYVLKESLRVGGKVIVGIPNFAYIKARCDIFFQGKTPVTESLPYGWYDTPNLHFLSIKDFKGYCVKKNFVILEQYNLGADRIIKMLPNLFATSAIFVLAEKSLL